MRVVLVGVGGLGCPILLALAPRLPHATFVLVDDDVVDVSNLQRQILFTTAEVGQRKVDVAAAWLRAQGIAVETHAVRVGPGHEALFAAAEGAPGTEAADVILDGTDSLDAKFWLNDLAVARRVPLVHGGVVGWRGQLMSVVPGQACYRCLFEAPPQADELPPTCAQAGIVGAFAGIVGARMAAEALAVVAGAPRLAGTLETLTFDLSARALRTRRVPLRPRPGCAACAIHHSPGATMAKVRIPTPLRKLTGGEEEVTVDGRTIGELITNLEARFPGIKDRICDDKGAVRRFVNIFVKDEDVRFLQQLDTQIADGDEVSIVPAIAGGAGGA